LQQGVDLFFGVALLYGKFFHHIGHHGLLVFDLAGPARNPPLDIQKIM
jgi:hypothetical protein